MTVALSGPASSTTCAGPAAPSSSSRPVRRRRGCLALSLLFIFLCLVALYESWTLPLAVIAIVPTGLMGAAAAIFLRGMPRCLLQGGRGGDPWGWPPRTRS
ncbi:hypothetical protein N234_20125 [Ralstonia pickettii DTP0602]|nr:hypothetical protein N234_20125 [Ralstonia pickettii DTP0602]